MTAKTATTPVGICKIAIIVLGVVVMGVGLHSHFQSNWTNSNFIVAGIKIDTGLKLYELCELPEAEKCPKISLERYFVSMVIICFILSLVSLIASIAMDISKFKLVDLILHGAAAVLILIAAIVYIVSAVQIKDLGIEPLLELDGIEVNLLFGEKIAASALAIIQALLYGVTAAMISKG